MAIEPHPKSDTSPEDQEVLRRVYADQLRDLRPRLEAAVEARDRAAAELSKARSTHESAAHEAAWLQGQEDAIRLLAARDNIHDL